METTERKKRDLEVVTDPEKRVFILKPVHKESKKITFYKILAKYIHIECTILEERPQGNYLLEINSLVIAKGDRDDSRIRPPEGTVWITNVKTSKTDIDAGLNNIPTFIKVNFSEYQNKLRHTSDYIKVDVFQSSEDHLNLVRTTGRTLYIEDTQNPESYKAISDDFIDYAEELGDDLKTMMTRFKNKKIVSEMIVPVIYISHDEIGIPIGYIHMQSKSTKFDMGKVMEVKTLAFEMVDRIRESNTMVNSGRFPVLDLSTGGIRVRIDDPQLVNELPRHPGFTFDLFFKMQSPLTVYGLIRSVTKDKENGLYMGIAIAGNSSRQGERKRFLENLNILKKG
ncbi:MAG: DUF1577 domain-containing protein [Leptospira sp.]|nr:DUF1577 domain-containing protein [Leptospira sp.]